MGNYILVLTCEHAGNQIPSTFGYVFTDADKELNSHRGWDPGALEITQAMAEDLGVDYFSYEYTRLLIEINRSEKHPQLYSEYSHKLMTQDKNYLLKTYYQPYRKKIEGVIRDYIEEGFVVVHVAVHTFTPVWEEKEREVEIGLLFDDLRETETLFCKKWQQAMSALRPTLNVRFNEPYRGSDDGFTTSLRSRFTQHDYLGLELEVSQKFVWAGLDEMKKFLSDTLRQGLDGQS